MDASNVAERRSEMKSEEGSKLKLDTLEGRLIEVGKPLSGQHPE